MNSWEYVGFVALCAASISYTVTWAGIFKWLRELVTKWGSWFEDLIHCPYCFCHYVILVIMFTTKDLDSYLIHINDWIVYNFLFTWFVIVCCTCLLHVAMLIAYKPVAEVESFRKLKELKKRNSKQE